MKQIIVNFHDRTVSAFKFINNDLQWYDPIKKELFIFEGGQLEFEYKEDEYLVSMGNSRRIQEGITSTFRLLPKVTKLKIKSSEKVSDHELFVKFFNNYVDYNNSGITANIIEKKAICLVPATEEDDFTYQLNRQGFNYE
jgi:hypothetical protein